MPKKKKVEVSDESSEVVNDSPDVSFDVSEEAVIPSSISLLSLDFGRQDLNTMAAKINEIIEKKADK